MSILDVMKQCEDSYSFKLTDMNGYLSVKKDFLDKCSNPEEHPFLVLVNKYNVIKYFHNLKVQAVQAITSDGELMGEYWVNGVPAESVRYEKKLIPGIDVDNFHDMVKKYKEKV